MPLYVRNRVIFNGAKEEVNKIFAFIKGENGAIDFNSIIPSPIGIDKTRATFGGDEDTWMWLMRYGYPSWYEWRCDNWGTKWNAGDINTDGEDNNFIEFDTAWNAPFPIIDRLAKNFPNVEIIHKWADEDTAYNCGEHVYRNGTEDYENIPDGGSKEAYELAFDLRPYLRDEYEIVDGEYRYKYE